MNLAHRNPDFPYSLACLACSSNIALIPCQCFMETCTGDLAKTSTNKAYQEKKRDSIWKIEKIYSHYSNEMMIDT
jgi:hypothetical protein